jgi:galactokinase/mevalonate kinase-like predicted kinase
VESSIYLVSLGPRFGDYDVMANTNLNRENARALADAADGHWQSILDQDVVRFGKTMREVFDAQVALFPNTMNERVAAIIDEYRNSTLGWKLSGAGGGGYMVLVSEKPIPGAVRVIARRGLD